MKEGRKTSFEDKLDLVQMINRPARRDLGEDSFYCAKSGYSAIVSVCDGCGGLGARKYQTFKNHTGAYIASRTVSGAIHDWYHQNYKKSWKRAGQLADSIDEYIRRAYQVCEPYAIDRMKIRGSMVRKFPTTLALAYAEDAKDGVLVHLLWAGDSRVYLLDEDGLAQLTLDDTEVEDALENLTSDGAMTNVLSADGNYKINSKTIQIDKPTLIFAATDGCFGYIPSPMEFEYILVNTIVRSKTPEEFRALLYRQFSQYAGDDFAFGMMSYYFDDYQNTRRTLKPRRDYLERNYVSLLEQERDDEVVRKLWSKYKKEYERYLT